MNNQFFCASTKRTGIVAITTLMLLVVSSLQTEAQDNKRQEPQKEVLTLDRISGTFVKAGLAPGVEHKMLDQLIGRWINEGETIGNTTTPAIRIVTSDVYEWAPGGFFVIHYAYGRAGKEYGGAIEIIGYDQASKKYLNYCFDSNGILTQEELKISKNALSSSGKHTRSTGVFTDNGNTLTVRHERSDNGGKTWIPAMDVRLVKIK